MLVIQGITSDPVQFQNLTLPDGTIIQLTITFVPLQYGWFITDLVYSSANFELQGMRISCNPNMLRQYKNIIPFGIACFAVNNREPSQQDDFASGQAALYILTSDEVAEYEAYLSGT